MIGTGVSIILRLKLQNQPGKFGEVASAIGREGGNIGAIDIVRAGPGALTRDVTVEVRNTEHGERIVEALQAVPGVTVVNVSDRTFLLHLGGKIEVRPRVPVKNRDDLSMVYTPGVGRISQAIAADPDKAFTLTIKRNTVAVITDGSAVLGLGDLGPLAALPVMEGKCLLFKQLAGVDAFPLCLDARDPEELIAIIKALSPSFGGINLEDIASPRCFEIESRLRAELDIPVFHDDQHGTAVVVLAGLLNAARVVERPIEEMKVVVVGIGAAGVACSRMLMAAGVEKIIGCDREGAIYPGRHVDSEVKAWYATHTNPEGRRGCLSDVIEGADVFLGVSGPGVLTEEDVRRMAPAPIVFALANPTPEIDPEAAWRAGARVVATGRSDFPNQINNCLCFPGLFKGALESRAREVNEAMKLAAARAIASVVKDGELSEEYIIPTVFNRRVVEAVSAAVAAAAHETGVARREREGRGED